MVKHLDSHPPVRSPPRLHTEGPEWHAEPVMKILPSGALFFSTELICEWPTFAFDDYARPSFLQRVRERFLRWIHKESK